MSGDVRRSLLALRTAQLTPPEWDEIRMALLVSPIDDLVISRLIFVAKIRHRPSPGSPVVGGKGSPTALIICAAISALLLGGTAALLGGGLIYVPAAIPVVTVAAVLGARWWSSLRDRRASAAAAVAVDDDREPIPADVRDSIDNVLWPTAG
jgi:hypothetical protein